MRYCLCCTNTTKLQAAAWESLASFYEACAQIEVDEYRDYEKALQVRDRGNAAKRRRGKGRWDHWTTHAQGQCTSGVHAPALRHASLPLVAPSLLS